MAKPGKHAKTRHVSGWSERLPDLVPPEVFHYGDPQVAKARRWFSALKGFRTQRGFEDDLRVLRRQLRELTAYVQANVARGEHEALLVEDPIIRYLNDHQDEVRRYRGKKIAVTAAGIVASADTFEDLEREVERLGIRGRVVFDAVPEL